MIVSVPMNWLPMKL
jgi:sterol carrier protein 2